MSSCIVLAAGKAQRMGFPKGLMKINSHETLIEQQLKKIDSYGIKKIFIVVWHARDEYEKACQSITFSEASLKFVENPLSDFGPFSSIKAGIRSWLVENTDEKFVSILPVDCPILSREGYDQLLKNIGEKIQVVVPSFQKKGGHPAIISRLFAEKLIKVDLEREDARLDVQISMLRDDEKKYAEVQDESVLKNFNTPVTLQD